MRGKYVEPSVNETAFNCPHCGALATQTWYDGRARKLDKDRRPNVWTHAEIEAKDYSTIDDKDVRAMVKEHHSKVATGNLYLTGGEHEYSQAAVNVTFSECYNCSNIALWIHDRLAWPAHHSVISAVPDMPEDVRADFEEAGNIYEASPRGAAALLRLSIQKLCCHLGEDGKNINTDIAALVSKGLDPRIQQALDVVRVIGNNAVHPGHIDIKDDRDTARQLFSLVNLIVDVLITQPAHIATMYSGLGAGILAAIDKRDGKTAGS